jgi:hypothetical protein
MKRSRAAASGPAGRAGGLFSAVLAAGLLLVAWVPAARAESAGGLTLSVAHRWNKVASPGTWTPYAVTVRNDGARLFTGSVLLVPNPVQFGQVPFVGSFPQYRAALSVAAGTERTVFVYVAEAPNEYHATLRDEQGRTLARADPASVPHASAALAILSDQPLAGQRIAAPLKTLSQLDAAISQFSSIQSFPSSAVFLSGLDGVILDQFNSAALSQPQLQALKDFVALGGTLILGGGSSGRRTLLPLPSELLPVKPADTADASLAPLAELGGMGFAGSVQVLTGEVASWGRVALTSTEGIPLAVEGSYGGGRVVVLTFDPLARPLDTQPELAALSWSQAITRALSGVPNGSQFSSSVGPPQPGTLGGSGLGTWLSFPGYLDQIIAEMPAAAPPPFGPLVALLVAYTLLVSLVTYVVLKILGRRGLFWIAVPALAILFTVGTYAAGLAGRGSDYQLMQVQVQRLGPGGVVETYGFEGVASPRRGDLKLAVAPGTLVSTAILQLGPPGTSGSDALVSLDSRQEVLLSGVPIWDVRPLQTLTVTRPFPPGPGTAMPIEAQLRIEQGRIKGQVVNHTSSTVRELQVVSPSGTAATLTTSLVPGATVAVDAQLTQGPGLPLGKGSIGNGVVVGSGGLPTETGKQALVAMAVSQAASRPGDLALVGLTQPVDTLSVEGERATRSTRAILVEPVRLLSTDSLASLSPSARLVSSYTANGRNQLDVYELELPGPPAGHVGLSSLFIGGPQSLASPADVYDWDAGLWRPLTLQSVPGRSSSAMPLTAGEVARGVIRVRVQESSPGLTVFSATDLP